MVGFKNILQISLPAFLLAQSTYAAPTEKWEMTAVDGSGADATYQKFLPWTPFDGPMTKAKAEARAKGHWQWFSKKQTNPGVLIDTNKAVIGPRAQMVAVTLWNGAKDVKGSYGSEIPKGNIKKKIITGADSPIHKKAFASAKFPHAEDASWVMAEAAAKLPEGTIEYPEGTITVVWGLRASDFEKDPTSLSNIAYRPKAGKEDGYRIPMCSRGDVSEGDRVPTCQVVGTALGVE